MRSSLRVRTPTDEIFGRDEELAAIEAFLGSTGRLPGVLLLEGEPGIGKTTLWHDALRQAQERGFRICLCAPIPAEARLSFVGLRDLVDEVAIDEAGLPEPQRRALAAALLRESPSEAVDAGAVAAAFLGVLHRLVADGPLLVAIDDVQSLDRSSATVIAYALRRLREAPVAIVVARRDGDSRSPLELDRLRDRLSFETISLGPISLGALRRVLTRRLGVTLRRPVLVRIQEISCGNPFFALELGRAFVAGGGDAPVVPSNVHEALRARLHGLPTPTREALALVAAAGAPELRVVEDALEPDSEDALDPAYAAGLVERIGGRIRFTHPLFASAAYERLPAGRRRSLHMRLSEVIDDPEERARHLALAAAGPDAVTAGTLEQAASLARVRGATGAAAELLEHARRLTPDGDVEGWGRRTIDAADAYASAGDEPCGQALLREALDRLPAGTARARALSELGWWTTSIDLCEQAAAEAGDDSLLRARIDYLRAVVHVVHGELRPALVAGTAAVAAAQTAGDPTLKLMADTVLGHVETLMGLDGANARLQMARRLEETSPYVRAYNSPTTMLGRRLMVHDELDSARQCFVDQRQRAIEHGDEESGALMCVHLAELEWRAGNWIRAQDCAREVEDFIGRRSSLDPEVAVARYVRALISAHLGDLDDAHLLASEGVAVAEAGDWKLWAARNRAVLGFVELCRGEYEAAVRRLAPLTAQSDQMGVTDPSVFLYAADEIEALTAAGKLAEAEERLFAFEQRGRELDRRWILCTGGRCRGLLLAARGELSGALASLQEAITMHERLAMPFERGRTLLVLGQTQRRAKQKRAARESLGAAIAVFDELCASVWAEKARSELARIGGRTPGPSELTPTQRRVAELVAEGRSNKEIAAALFVTVKAVEANLSRMYAKLGVRSRTELVRRLSSGVPPSKV